MEVKHDAKSKCHNVAYNTDKEEMLLQAILLILH